MFEKISALALLALEETGLKKDDGIVLTRGSAVIHKGQKDFKDLFGIKTTTHLDPNEVHVMGALDFYQIILRDPSERYQNDSNFFLLLVWYYDISYVEMQRISGLVLYGI